MTEVKSKRTQEQIRYLWAIIHEIAIARSGRRGTIDELDIYAEGLERANIKHIDICVPFEKVEDLRNYFRAIKVIGTETNTRGNKVAYVRCYQGISDMNGNYDREEMSLLVDTFLDMASESGVIIDEINY